MTIVIRKMLPHDVTDAVLVCKKNFPSLDDRGAASLPAELGDMFSDAVYRPTYHVVLEADRVVGLGGWNWGWFNYDTYELMWGQLLPEYRGRGLGRELIEVRLADIRAAALRERGRRTSYVVVSTHLDEMYARYGFKTIATMDLWQSSTTRLMVREL